MNKNEMIKNLINVQKKICDDKTIFDCVQNECYECIANGLMNAGLTFIFDDEIVIKKSEYEELNTNIEDLQTKLGAVMLCIKNTHELDISDILEKQKRATAREILKLIEYYDIEHPVLTRSEVFERVATKYGIDLEEYYEREY